MQVGIWISAVCTGFSGWGGVPRGMGLLFYIGEIENVVFFHTRKFQNFLKINEEFIIILEV